MVLLQYLADGKGEDIKMLKDILFDLGFVIRVVGIQNSIASRVDEPLFPVSSQSRLQKGIDLRQTDAAEKIVHNRS